MVVYSALAYARRSSAGCGGACIPEGIEFAFLTSVEVLVAVLIVSLGTKLWQELWFARGRRVGATGEVANVSSAGSGTPLHF